MSSNPHGPPPGTLLLVDDEPAILDLLGYACDAAGYRYLRALNGADALELFRRNHCDIAAIITDVNMPVLDGFGLVRGAREIEPEIKIILSSGSLGEAERRIAADLRNCALLAKPYTPAQMVTCIRSVLGAGHPTKLT